MRIHYLSPSTVISDSANSVHVMRMCQAFALTGHDVVLHAHWGGGDDDEAFGYYGIEERFRLVRHNEAGSLPVKGIRALSRIMPMRVTTPSAIVFGRLAVAPIVRADEPTLVYARNFNWLAGLPGRIPFIVEAHVEPAKALHLRIQANLFSRPGFRRLVVISSKLKDMYTSLFPNIADRILVAHDAADDPFPERWPRPDLPGFQVGFVGHLYPGRGGELMKAIAEALPDMTFHLVGGTEGDRARLVALGLTPNVILHGHQPPATLAKFFPTFDAVLAPYQRRVAFLGGRGDISAVMSPMKLFEYMSWGKAILCSNLPVLREIIEDGRTGLMLCPDNAADWIGALQRLRDNSEERAQLGTNARNEFLAKYTWRSRSLAVLDGIPF